MSASVLDVLVRRLAELARSPNEVPDPWTGSLRPTSIRVMSREPTAIELLALGGFVLSGGFVAAALDEGWPRLDRTRWGCLALTGALLCGVLVGRGPGWTVMLGCLAFLMSLIAVALAAHGERVEPGSETTLAEPTWWPQFERDFAEYVRLAPPGERHGDSGRAS
jgi:hypothetical protein